MAAVLQSFASVVSIAEFTHINGPWKFKRLSGSFDAEIFDMVNTWMIF